MITINSLEIFNLSKDSRKKFTFNKSRHDFNPTLTTCSSAMDRISNRHIVHCSLFSTARKNLSAQSSSDSLIKSWWPCQKRLGTTFLKHSIIFWSEICDEGFWDPYKTKRLIYMEFLINWLIKHLFVQQHLLED